MLVGLSHQKQQSHNIQSAADWCSPDMLYVHSLARTQPSTKAKHPFAALSRFPSRSVHQNGFFFGTSSKKQRSYMHIHTHQQRVYYALALWERQRLSRFLFLFISRSGRADACQLREGITLSFDWDNPLTARALTFSSHSSQQSSFPLWYVTPPNGRSAGTDSRELYLISSGCMLISRGQIKMKHMQMRANERRLHAPHVRSGSLRETARCICTHSAENREKKPLSRASAHRVHFLCFLIIRDLSARPDLLIPTRARERLSFCVMCLCAATFAALSLCFFLIKKSKITFSWLPNANSNYSISCVPPPPFFFSSLSPLMQILNIYTHPSSKP